jgi:tetratricopeptide (TPR) repeat protein
MRRISAGILMLCFVARLPAQDLRDPRFVERAQAGFTDIYNLDYEKARKVFLSLDQEYPQHPAPPLYLSCILWLDELNRRQDLVLTRYMSPLYFVSKTEHAMPPQERDAFFQYLQQSEARSNAILKQKPKDMDARYFLAMANGLRASFAITIDHNLRAAFGSGAKASSSAKQLTQENPNYYDAYLAVGIYEYVVASIPWYLRWIPFIMGLHGGKQDGMQHLSIAAEKGQYIRNEAQIVLMILCARELRYTEALEIAEYLGGIFPRNFLFPLSTAQIYQFAGRKDQAVAAYMRVLQRVESKEPNFDKLSLSLFRYSVGNELMTLGRPDLAREQFRKSIDDPQTPAREKALSHLRLGQILDSKGLRSEAKKEYQAVLALQDVENSHSQAKDLIKKP